MNNNSSVDNVAEEIFYEDGFCSLFSCECDNGGDCKNCVTKLKYELHNNQEALKEFIECLEDKLLSIDRDSFEPDKVNCHIAKIRQKIATIYPEYQRDNNNNNIINDSKIMECDK